MQIEKKPSNDFPSYLDLDENLDYFTEVGFDVTPIIDKIAKDLRAKIEEYKTKEDWHKLLLVDVQKEFLEEAIIQSKKLSLDVDIEELESYINRISNSILEFIINPVLYSDFSVYKKKKYLQFKANVGEYEFAPFRKDRIKKSFD